MRCWVSKLCKKGVLFINKDVGIYIYIYIPKSCNLQLMDS